MRVTIDGSGNILTHGDSLSGGSVIEFPVNELPGFPSGWTVSGSAPSRKLRFQGHEVAVETPTAEAERVPSTGGGGVTIDNTVDPPMAVATLVAPGAEIVGDEARLFSSTATGTGVTASVSMTATAEGGDAEAKRTATTDLGAANVTSFATVTDAGGGVAEANNVATSQAHNATANLSANVVAGFGAAQASNAAASFNGNADATSSAYAAGDGNAVTSNFAGVGGTGTATADLTAFGGAGTAWVKVEADATSARIGFFATAPVAQPAAPTTLADVIAALKALGLVAT
jgi:hypothetical protein